MLKSAKILKTNKGLIKMNFFGFIDETGILQDVDNQPYFALGLLRLKNTSDLLQKIMSIKARHNGIFQNDINLQGNIDKGQNFNISELKFNKLKTKRYLQLYMDIISACLEYDHFYFSARVVNKKKLLTNQQSIDTWKLQLKLSKFHIKAHCKDSNKIAIIADYLNRPQDKPSFEHSINQLPQVFNSCMLESDTSIFIQIVDILIGAVVYRYKNPEYKNSKKKPIKMQFVEFLEQELLKKASNNDKSSYSGALNSKFTIFGNNFYFSVYDK